MVREVLRHRPRNVAWWGRLALCNFLLSWPGHRFRVLVLRRLAGANVDPSCSIARGVHILWLGPGLTIGERTIIAHDVMLASEGVLDIGSGVNIARRACLLSGDHDPHSPEFAGRVHHTIVEDRVWIATSAIILPGARIGEGAIIGAGSVVHGEVEPWTIVAGNPARQIGTRSSDAQVFTPEYRAFLH
jgi:acetyltransferase-like isoleucine patch superfamily enzyme